MVRKLSKAAQDAIYAPRAKSMGWASEWKKAGAPKIQPRELTFIDIIVLRRLQAGQSSARICAEMHIARSTLNTRVAAIIKRFDVETREELLALPEVIAQIAEEK